MNPSLRHTALIGYGTSARTCSVGVHRPGDSEEAIRHIKRLIDEFCTVDPLATAFRYPEDREGNPSLPGISTINLRNIKKDNWKDKCNIGRSRCHDT